MWTIIWKVVQIVLNAITNGFVNNADKKRDDQAHEDVGVLKQKQADEEAARKAQEEANNVSLEPRDRANTLKRLRDGDY